MTNQYEGGNENYPTGSSIDALPTVGRDRSAATTESKTRPRGGADGDGRGCAGHPARSDESARERQDADAQPIVTDGGTGTYRGQTQTVDDDAEDEDDLPETDPQSLTLFQQNILLVLGGRNDQSDYGLAIKRGLEDLYGEEVNHGRLYPNLDTLVEEGLVAKSQLDKRTNQYELTPAGRELLRRDAQRRHGIVDHLEDR